LDQRRSGSQGNWEHQEAVFRQKTVERSELEAQDDSINESS
jgi:hypothetical protein